MFFSFRIWFYFVRLTTIVFYYYFEDPKHTIKTDDIDQLFQ